MPRLLAATIGDALGVEHGPTRTHLQSLVEHLGPLSLTLVLDNMEQLPDAAGDIATLMRSCPDVRVVATSRVPLRIAGEVRFVVRALDGSGDDPANRPGVRLFLERASATGFGAGQGADDLAAVAELCIRLDGLPLAIELAAARSRIVAPTEMLRHLDKVLDLLSQGRSDAPTQHRSIRAALEWSFRLLPPAAQEAFAALGVFATGASTEAAMAVWGLPPTSTPTFFDLVQILAEAHMIGVEPAGSGPGIRIEMFETTRQFARHKLDESDGAELAHRRLDRVGCRSGGASRAGPVRTGPGRVARPARPGATEPASGPAAAGRAGHRRRHRYGSASRRRPAAVLGHPIPMERGRGLAERRVGAAGRHCRQPRARLRRRWA